MPGPSTDLIRSVAFFSDLDDREAANLARDFVERTYGAGDVIVGEGQQGMSFFLVESGSADVVVHGTPAGSLSAGESFGELSLFEKHAVRAATITATSDMRCWSLPVYSFRAFVEGHPGVSWKLLEHLAARLRAATQPS